jgi:NADP-dependent 3-hydroxy acid dehydrogenase YdfG
MNELDQYAPQQVKGKNILVTGGTTGIGRSAARILAGLGANVFINGRHLEQLEEAIQDTHEMYPGSNIQGIVSDISDPQAIDKTFEAAEQAFGKIDVLINNAGLSAEGMKEGTYEEWHYVLHTNLLSYMAFANKAAKAMKGRGGHIINIGSMSAEAKNPESTVYVATKSGIRGFSAALGKELNPDGIKVTLIEPGLVTSDMPPGGSVEHQRKIAALEMLAAEDITASIIYCLSQPKRCNIVSIQVRPLKQEV